MSHTLTTNDVEETATNLILEAAAAMMRPNFSPTLAFDEYMSILAILERSLATVAEEFPKLGPLGYEGLKDRMLEVCERYDRWVSAGGRHVLGKASQVLSTPLQAPRICHATPLTRQSC